MQSEGVGCMRKWTGDFEVVGLSSKRGFFLRRREGRKVVYRIFCTCAHLQPDGLGG